MNSLKKRIISLFCIFFFLLPAAQTEPWFDSAKNWFLNKQDFADTGLGAQYLVPASHWIYESLYSLTLEAGNVPLGNKSPIPAGELEVYFKNIDFDKLSDSGKSVYNKAEAWFTSIHTQRGRFPIGLNLNPSINPAFFYRNLHYSSLYPYADHTKIPSLINFPFALNILDYAFLFYDVSLFQQWEFANSTRRFINIPLNSNEVDATFSRLSHMSLGIPLRGKNFWNFKIGRGGLNIGKTATPSIILSDTMNTATYAQLSFFSPNIKYSANIMQLAVNKYAYFHTLDFRLFKRLTLSFTEGLMVNAPLELTYLNPLELFHGLEPWGAYSGYNKDLGNHGLGEGSSSRVGTLLGIAVDLNPWKYTRLYALFQMNQFQLPSEPKTLPNAWGTQGGLDVHVPIRGGYLQLNAEALYTTPYMYKLENKNWSFCMERRGFYGSGQHQWTGTPFGPDSIMAQFSVGYNVPGTWAVNSFYRFLIQGSMHAEIDSHNNGYWKIWPTRDAAGKETISDAVAEARAGVKTPTGIPKYTHKFGLEGSYILNRWFRFKGYTGFSWIINDANKSSPAPKFGFEAALSCEFSLFGGWRNIL